MKTIKWWMLFLMSCLFTAGWAQGEQVQLKVSEAVPGQLWNLEVGFENPKSGNFTAFQMDLQLPEGFCFDETTLEAGTRLLGHQCSATLSEQRHLRVIAHSSRNAAISGHSGALFVISFRPVEGVETGAYEATARDIFFALRDGREQRMADATVTYSYQPTDITRSFTVNYLVDGKEVAQQQVEEGAAIPAVPQPEKEGHTFVGWANLPDVMPNHDLTVTAVFSVNTYVITYMLDGEEYGKQEVKYGEEVQPLEVTPEEGKEFLGWNDLPATMPAHHLTIYGTTVATGITQLTAESRVDVYNLQGVKVASQMRWSDVRRRLPSGIYVVNGQLVSCRR